MAKPVRLIDLREAKSTPVTLTDSEAKALQRLGRRLASSATWWGDDDETPERTVIRVRPAGGTNWDVRVADVVGSLSIGTTQFVVHPKIDQEHLLHLMTLSGLLPRLDPQTTSLKPDASLWQLVATWFTRTAEAVLRRDAIRDYREHTDDLAIVRGRIDVPRSSRGLLKGDVRLRVTFDEFDADNPFNRLLLAAALRVAASPTLALDLRQQARRVALRLDGVSSLQPSDLLISVDRRTGHYRDALALAKSVLSGSGRALRHGTETAWTFLLRTPDFIEAGVRATLALGLTGHSVTKQGRQLPQSTKSLHPDLVFDGGDAVGDVKYKTSDSEWINADLYQAVAFAAGYRTGRALLVSFSSSGKRLAPLQVGDITVTHLTWNLSSDPTTAANDLVADVQTWLDPRSKTT